MTGLRGDALEVWGDPIAHSRSPDLHAAAYAHLGLPWTYGRRQVSAAAFERVRGSLDGSFRGLSLTFPLKAQAFAAAVQNDRHALLTGAVNTLLLGVDDGPRGFNTDVAGIARDLRSHGMEGVQEARIVGAGATAASALIALGELGAKRVEVVARRTAAVELLRELGVHIGVEVAPVSFDELPTVARALTISTLPGGAVLSDDAADAIAASRGLLYDVVYGHWPTALAAAWLRNGDRAVSGFGMLVQQALIQVRVFVSGDPAAELPDEEPLLARMRDAVM